LVLMEAPVIMVGTDAVEVERQLSAGELVCPCGKGLIRWGYARSRIVRGLGRRRPRRVRCQGCRATHVVLSVACLFRRADAVEVIGAALRAKAAGTGHRPIAARLDRPASTVRGWLRRFGRNAEMVRSMLVGLLVELDPLHSPIGPLGSGFVDAVEMVGLVAAAARRRLGVVGAVSPWQLVSAVTDGRLLALRGPSGVANTN
jgi:transposase-like protein